MLTRMLATLEQAGLIGREVVPTDRRQILIFLTSAGRRLLMRDAERQERWVARMMATTLDDAETAILCAAMHIFERLADIPHPSRDETR